MSSPVTVSITRHVDPAHTDEMIAWIRAGGALAVRFEGFLGTGWVRPAPDSDRWHMLYRLPVFFPLGLAASWLSSRYLADVPFALRVLTSTVALTPVMTYVALPWITRRMEWWLHR